MVSFVGAGHICKRNGLDSCVLFWILQRKGKNTVLLYSIAILELAPPKPLRTEAATELWFAPLERAWQSRIRTQSPAYLLRGKVPFQISISIQWGGEGGGEGGSFPQTFQFPLLMLHTVYDVVNVVSNIQHSSDSASQQNG